MSGGSSGSEGCEIPSGTRLGIAMSMSTPSGGLGDPGSVGQRGAGSAGHCTASQVVVSSSGASGAVSQVGKAVPAVLGVTHETRNTHSATDSGTARLGTVNGDDAPLPSWMGGLDGAWSCGAGGSAGGPLPLPPPPLGGGSFGAGGVSPAGAQSHSQSQFQSQSRPVPSPASVEISVVVPHQVNVQAHTHDGSPDPLGAGVGRCVRLRDGAVVARAQDPDRHVHVRGPGLRHSRTRDLRCQSVDVAGAALLAGASSHVQFQIQFHVQSRELLLPVSSETDKTLPSQTVSVHVQFHGASSGDGS